MSINQSAYLTFTTYVHTTITNYVPTFRLEAKIYEYLHVLLSYILVYSRGHNSKLINRSFLYIVNGLCPGSGQL